MADAPAAKPAPKKAKKAAAFKPAEKFCPKDGVRMASHKDRFSCGKCHYTEWKKKA